jgi:hypothetical protein
VARDKLAWLPAVCVVWANTHALVVFGIVIAGAATLEALVWSADRFKRDIAIGVCCVAAPTLSPATWHYWPQVFRTVALSRSLELQEYRPPLDASSLPFWVAVVVLVTATYLRRADLSTWRRGDRILLLASAVLAVAAVGASRNIAFFAVIAAPALSRLLTMPGPVERPRQRPAGALGYAAIAVALVVAAATVAIRWRDGGARQLAPSATVVDAVRACPDPDFQPPRDGGYSWALPNRRVRRQPNGGHPTELLNKARPPILRRLRPSSVAWNPCASSAPVPLRCAGRGSADVEVQTLTAAFIRQPPSALTDAATAARSHNRKRLFCQESMRSK